MQNATLEKMIKMSEQFEKKELKEIATQMAPLNDEWSSHVLNCVLTVLEKRIDVKEFVSFCEDLV